MDSRNVFLALITGVILLTGNPTEGKECGYTTSIPEGILDYPTSRNYTNNLNCTWNFVAPIGRVVEVTFTTINLEPPGRDTCYDVITVFDGIPGLSIVSFCGDGPFWPRKPYRFLSTSNKLSITLATDASITGAGFVAEYKHVLPRNESIAAINVDVPSILQFNRFAPSIMDTIPLLQSTCPSALDFDPITEFFYYTDIDVGFIGRIKYDTTSEEILVEENVQTPLGVAVGYLTGLLYWTDVDQHEVSVSRLDGTFRKTLVFPNTGCSSPRDIALSADQQNLFWTCAQKIMKAEADGSERQTLVGGLNDPRAIVLDEEMFLYWVDVHTASVGRIRTDGALKEDLFVHEIFSSVHSFVLDTFTYYWSRPADKDIRDLDRHEPNLVKTLSPRDPVTMEGLYYYKSDQHIPQQHTCATEGAGCQELCFPQGLKFSCVDVSPAVLNCPNEIKINASQSFQQVSWNEPVAMSRTSQQNGRVLTYNTRTSLPGDRFRQGTTSVTYTFIDELSNTATCSFNVVVLPECGYTTSIPKGILDYVISGNYTNNLNCTWNFVAPIGRVVEVTFTTIDLQPPVQDTCFDAITVYDGIAGLSPLTSSFCGDGPIWSRRPCRFISTSNRLSITLVTDASVTGAGFVAEYKHVFRRRESIAAINVKRPSIIQINRFSSKLLDPIPLLQSTRPSALDFDPITEFFYYTDLFDGFIGRIKLDATSEEVLIEENVQKPLGVAVGFLTGLLYWTDVDRHEVSVSRLDGTFRKILVFPNTNCSSPRDIILNAAQQNVFWTCAQKIMKAKADGSDSQTLVGGLINPRTIVLDEEMFLYWVDVHTASVGRIRTDGALKEDLFQHDFFSSVHSFVLDSSIYFWSRPAHKDILQVYRHEPDKIVEFSTTNNATMEGLYYYKSDEPIEQQHTCATEGAGCQELCFPQGLTFSCVDVSPRVLNCPNEIRINAIQSFQHVSWYEPVAISRTSQPRGRVLTYNTRTSMPGDRFRQGATNVTYTFKDELSNTATCSFNVVVLPVETTTSLTPSSSPSFDVFPVAGILVLCLVLCILPIAVCTWYGSSGSCSYRTNRRGPTTTQSFDNMGYDNNGAVNMVPVGGYMPHQQTKPPYTTYPSYPPANCDQS